MFIRSNVEPRERHTRILALARSLPPSHRHSLYRLTPRREIACQNATASSRVKKAENIQTMRRKSYPNPRRSALVPRECAVESAANGVRAPANLTLMSFLARARRFLVIFDFAARAFCALNSDPPSSLSLVVVRANVDLT